MEIEIIQRIYCTPLFMTTGTDKGKYEQPPAPVIIFIHIFVIKFLL